MLNVLRVVGRGFKWLGKKTLWIVKRNETLLAISLAKNVIPIPALDKIVLLVRSLSKKNLTGVEKMAEALVKIQPILAAYEVEIDKESDVKYLIDTTLRILRKQIRVISSEAE